MPKKPEIPMPPATLEAYAHILERFKSKSDENSVDREVEYALYDVEAALEEKFPGVDIKFRLQF